MANKNLKVNDLLGALAQLNEFVASHSAELAAKGVAAPAVTATVTAALLELQALEQAQEDAKAALRRATLALNAALAARYPEFSSEIDLLRGALGSRTPVGQQLTNIRKLVAKGGKSRAKGPAGGAMQI
jgi:hypothetical protein